MIARLTAAALAVAALALVLASDNPSPGHYGVKDSATDGVAPPIVPVPSG